MSAEHGSSASSAGNGASIRMEDGRVSRALAWAYITVGGLFVSGLLWTASTLVQIKESLASIATTISSQSQINARSDARDDQQDARLSQHDREIATLEGRNLRGGPAEDLRRGH